MDIHCNRITKTIIMKKKTVDFIYFEDSWNTERPTDDEYGDTYIDGIDDSRTYKRKGNSTIED